ncbi:MAG: hypothetical protein RBR71_13415 [Gudongella sp.]|nr:hypothetical protein [Gudongella sp.]
MRFWAVVSGIISGVFLIDLITWLASGQGLGEMISGGPSSPLVIAIAGHLVDIPGWAFYTVCAVAVVVLSAIMCLAVMSSALPDRYKFGRRA